MSTKTLPTQAKHPWRATFRTVFQVGLSLASLLPVIAAAGGITTTQGVAQVLLVCAAITRIMATPGVNDFLRKFLPWLAADSKQDAQQ